MAELSKEDVAEIQDLVASGRKIDAIKLFREITGCGLAEAKQGVEALGTSGTLLAGEADSLAGISEDDVAALSAALTEGRKVEAVRLLRERSSMDLKGAKEAIDALEVRLGLRKPGKSGCMLIAAGLLALGGGLGYALI